MKSSLSFPDGFNEDDYHYLTPTEWGKFYRYQNPVYVIRFEGPVPVPIEREPTTDKKLQDRWAEEDKIWKSHQQARMNVECPMSILERFSTTAFDYAVMKLVKDFTFEELAEWIDSQTKGRWSAIIYGDKKKRKGHSYLVMSFERKEDAVLFKMFHT